MKLNDFLKTGKRKKVVKTVIPMADDPEIICCIGEAMKRGLSQFILIGEQAKIAKLARKFNVPLSAAEFIHETDAEKACDLAAQLVQDNATQVMMKGLVHTATFSKAFLNRKHQLIPPGQRVSHVAVFEIPTYHKLLIITDAALNISPSLLAKAGIIRNAVAFAQKLGIHHPKVACVSAIEKINPSIQSTLDAAELKKMGESGSFGDIIVDGPFGLDVAVSRDAAEIKGVRSPVAGDPDILLMPNLDAANVLYKSLTKFAGSRVAGVIAGAKAPIVMTSRSDTDDIKLLSLALAVRLCWTD